MGKFLKQYEILYKKAKVDLNTAKVILESFENGNIELDLEVVYFHLQQCAEKLVKALLDYKKIKFPHNHNIRELINIAYDNSIQIDNKEELSQLTQYAVEGRYSIIHDDFDDTDIYIKILDTFLKSIDKELNSRDIK